jgi:secondary thiamine-phosphate synthase enzyme
MTWNQTEFSLKARSRGFHLVTDEVLQKCPMISKYRIGLLHLFIHHTSAGLSINENADPDVPLDMETMMNRIVPEGQPIRHTIEGPDDMPAHVKSSLVGCELTIPICDGRLKFGTWQGIYLCEFRNRGGARFITATL